MNNVIDEHEYLVADLSFWDNKQTRTGYPGIKRKKNGGGVKELLVGHYYQFKDVITMDMVKEIYEKSSADDQDISEGILGLEYKSNDTDTSIWYSGYWYAIDHSYDGVPQQVWVIQENDTVVDNLPIIYITEEIVSNLMEDNSNINDWAILFEKEITSTDMPIIVVNGEAVALTKKYDTWEQLINSEIDSDRLSGFISRNGELLFNNRKFYKPGSMRVPETDNIVYMDPNYYTRH